MWTCYLYSMGMDRGQSTKWRSVNKHLTRSVASTNNAKLTRHYIYGCSFNPYAHPAPLYTLTTALAATSSTTFTRIKWLPNPRLLVARPLLLLLLRHPPRLQRAKRLRRRLQKRLPMERRRSAERLARRLTRRTFIRVSRITDIVVSIG